MIAKTAEAIEAPNLNEVPDWIARPEWLKSEGIQGFGGQPLVNRGELLGVLAVFSRTTIGPACLEWLRMIADHAAAAISQARAWDQIRQLKQQLEMENEYLQEEVKEAQAFGELIGQSSAMQTIGRQIELVAPTDAAVLILGESGTGKELVAREIHHRSRRASRPLIKRLVLELPSRSDSSPPVLPAGSNQPILDSAALRQFEIDNIRRALDAANGKVYGPGGAAALLGIKPTTLASRIKALDVRT